jgi:hypothetical protein
LGQGLAGGTDAGFVNTCQKVLNRLPSDREVVRGLETVPEWIQSLRDDEKENVFASKMQILGLNISNWSFPGRWMGLPGEHFTREGDCFQGREGSLVSVRVLVWIGTDAGG